MKIVNKISNKLGKRELYIVCSLAFMIIAAIVLTWFLEYRYFINSTSRTWSFAIGSPVPFLFNAFLMWLMLTVLWCIVGKPGTAIGIMWSLIIIVGYIHINKFNSRGFPLLPEDFQLATEASALSKFVSIWSIARLVLAIIIVILLTILFNKKLAKKLMLQYDGGSHGFIKKHLLPQRAVILVAAIIIFMSSTVFVRHNDGMKYQDIFLGTHFTAWNQNRNYDDNGFIIGFLYNLQKLRLTEPDEYSEEKIKSIKDEYDAIADKKNSTRVSAGDDNVSIVIILNESFIDPAVEFGGLKFEDYYPHTGGDVVPNLHKIMRENPSGYMYTLDYGGGTANIEFETFTGLTNFWANTVPYTALIPKAGDIPSVARNYKNQGYETVAVHPFNGGMYKRNVSLPAEGFDKFIDIYDMDYDEHDGNSQYINDRSAYNQVLKELKESDGKQVVGLITMQNHTPYNHDIYEETEFEITNYDIEEGRRGDIEIYYQSLHNSDKYLGEFIDGLADINKKVIVLFYGDHSAGLFDITNESELKEERDLSRVTPYFFYANYDANYSIKELPTTTPNCMVNTLHNALGWKKESYLYLLDEVCEKEPILAYTWVEDRETRGEKAIKEYELLTYDILGGKKYWMK